MITTRAKRIMAENSPSLSTINVQFILIKNPIHVEKAAWNMSIIAFKWENKPLNFSYGL